MRRCFREAADRGHTKAETALQRLQESKKLPQETDIADLGSAPEENGSTRWVAAGSV